MFHVRTALELLGTAPETAWTELPLFRGMEGGEGWQAPNVQRSHAGPVALGSRQDDLPALAAATRWTTSFYLHYKPLS